MKNVTFYDEHESELQRHHIAPSGATYPMLKVGLEIHTQLNTATKLFAAVANPTSNLALQPNSTASFFDLGLPGTQPTISPQCIHSALKLAAALNCNISSHSTFDRKHYFYGDQPLGYQITQHYHPIAQNGSISLLQRHHQRLTRDVTARIMQLQLEQDTGRTLYHSTNTSKAFIDYNRANIPLVEMVTMPDFQHVEEVRAFLQTYVKLVQDLQVCTGDLESGAIRVDVNVNVGAHPRVEIKNLPTISAIVNAIRFEEKRQKNIEEIDLSTITGVETRGWDGKRTFRLRSKESAVDYRYVPDMELPALKFDIPALLPQLKETLPLAPHDALDALMSQHGISARDAKVLHNNASLCTYFQQCWSQLQNVPKAQGKLINWLVHELLGALTKSEIPFSASVIDSGCFTQLISAVERGDITKPNGKLILLHLVNNSEDQRKPILELAKEFNMVAQKSTGTGIVTENGSHNGNNSGAGVINADTIVAEVIMQNASVVNEIINKGKTQKLNFLLGQCMRRTGGNVQPSVIREKLESALKK